MKSFFSVVGKKTPKSPSIMPTSSYAKVTQQTWTAQPIEQSSVDCEEKTSVLSQVCQIFGMKRKPALDVENFYSQGKKEVITAALAKSRLPVQEFKQLEEEYNAIPVKRKTATSMRKEIDQVSKKLCGIRKLLADEVYKLNELCSSLEKTPDAYFKFHMHHIPKITEIGESHEGRKPKPCS